MKKTNADKMLILEVGTTNTEEIDLRTLATAMRKGATTAFYKIMRTPRILASVSIESLRLELFTKEETLVMRLREGFSRVNQKRYDSLRLQETNVDSLKPLQEKLGIREELIDSGSLGH